MAKPERPPIFERLQPFAPWDQRDIPSLIDEPETKRRAGELASASDHLAEALRALADGQTSTEQVGAHLRHLGNVAEWSADVWRQAFDADEPAGGDLYALCEAAGQRADFVEAIAAISRVAVPSMVGAAVLLEAELGDATSMGRARWLRLLIDELETTRAELELTLQSHLRPGDGTRLAGVCAEVAKTVC